MIEEAAAECRMRSHHQYQSELERGALFARRSRFSSAINTPERAVSWWVGMYEKSGPIKNTEVVGSNW